jgi:succinate dehydrogenase hydrophobic anchor subunit
MEMIVYEFRLITALPLIITNSAHSVMINLHYKITHVVQLVSKNKMVNAILLCIIAFIFHKMINVWNVKMDITCM